MINPAEILKQVQAKNVDQAEVYLTRARSLKIDVRDEKVESIKEVDDLGCGIRVIKDQRIGFAYTSEFEDSVLAETINRAVENSRNTEADEFNGLPEKQPIAALPPAELFNEKLRQIPIGEKVELARSIEEAAYKADQRVKKTEKVAYSEAEGEVWLVNSNGLDAKYRANFCDAFAYIVASSNGNMEAGFGLDFAKELEALDPNKIGEEAAQRATELLGAKDLASQKMPLVLDPTVGVEILEVLATALSADAVQKGKSLFAGRSGQLLGSKLLTIIDNGRLKNGLSTAPFDAEGVPTQETKLFKNGTLKNYLFNTYAAKKGGTRSTGNAVRGSFQGLPMIGTTNLYIQPGQEKPANIIRSVKKGLYVTKIMGIHTANPISGDFSVGAAGLLIEHGQKTHPVRGITIAGNLMDMLKKIEAVGSDLRFLGDTGAPTILLHDMSLSGGK